jgi:S-formylglutathione hydrolase FrmB
MRALKNGAKPIWLLLAIVATCGAETRPLEFRLTFDPSITREPFSGRVYIMLNRSDPETNLRGMPSWFKPDPLLALDVKGWEPGKPLTVGASASGYPSTLEKLEKGTYYVQAVMDFGRGMSFSAAPGNGWCTAVKYELDPATGGLVTLRLDKVYAERKFNESDRIKLVDIESKLLTAFHGRPTRLRAGVVLPASWHKETGRKYPVVYEIPGFGGTHLMAPLRRNFTDVAGVEMLWVVLDPACPLGHHVFADSVNNGPCGQALVEELIPHIEKNFRGVGTPGGRFVTGHSSGGWSSLWLQVTYPDTFGGVWSTAPDPVDFRDFQRIDISKPGANMFVDADAKPRPVARRGDKPVLFYQPFSDLEEVMGHGGQLGSFEAVFSPRATDGRPAHLWDRRTGQVDPDVARAWQDYDIRLKLERNWKTLGPRLAGKIHVYTGGSDTFYLEGATRLLGESLKKLRSDAVVEIFPGKDHATLVDAPLRKRISEEMAAQWRRASTPKQ